MITLSSRWKMYEVVPNLTNIVIVSVVVAFTVTAQVLPQDRALKFYIWEDRAFLSDTKIINVLNVKSILQCSLMCLSHPWCIGASLDISLMTCQLREKEFEGTGQIYITNNTSQTALIINDISVVDYTKTWKNFGASDCYVGRSHEYSGTTSTTISGHTCQQWDLSYPHIPAQQPYKVSDRSTNYCRATKEDEDPWCYITSLDAGYKWEYCSIVPCFVCGVMDNLPPSPPNTAVVSSVREIPIVIFQCDMLQPIISQAHCPMSRCLNNEWTMNYTVSCSTEDCYTTIKDYKGKMSCTVSGIPCQMWNTNTPHIATYLPIDAESLGSNSCRDPSNSGFLWCYTMDSGVVWDFCSVPKC